MTTTNTWFAVDKTGLQKLIEHRGKAFVIFELLQNAWDESTRNVEVTLTMLPDRRGRARLVVTDDAAEGFADLRHAYTLFAESKKKADATKRGRFNLGEKLVLALCDEATIRSTTGGVTFAADGTRRSVRKRTTIGTTFEAVIRMTAAEYADVQERVRLLLPPQAIRTTFNGEPLTRREPMRVIEATLPTIVADGEGVLRSTQRSTTIDVHRAEGQAWLYELGIPVVETDLPYSVSVNQKVPLNQDRDNVTPAYYRRLATLLLNELHDELDADDASAPWIATALEDAEAKPEAVKSVLETRFGEKIVTADPSDRESNSQAIANGYAVLHGGQFSKEAWANIRAAGVAPAAGAVFPSPSPYHEDGEPEVVIDPSEWTQSMREVAAFAQRLGKLLIHRDVRIKMVERLSDDCGACYGRGRITFAVKSLGKPWFDRWQTEAGLARVVSLVLHELAHEDEPENHLTERFYKAIERFSGIVTARAIAEPSFFKPQA